MFLRILPVLIFIFSNTLCQQKPFHTPAVYVEGAGSGCSFYTVNFEGVVFRTGHKFAAFHVGFGAVNKKYFESYYGKHAYWSIPVGLTFFKGQGKHHAEAGGSVTYVSGYTDNSPYVSGFKELETSSTLFLVPNVGYRFHKPEGGFLFRFYLSPAFRLVEFADHSEIKKASNNFFPMGISVGYAFRSPGKEL